MQMKVCGEACSVSVSDGSTVKCAAPSMSDETLIDTFPEAFPSIDLATVASKFYTDRGDLESQLSEMAFTSSVQQQIDLSMGLGRRSECWFGFELPPSKEAYLTAVDFFPPTDPNRRAKAGLWNPSGWRLKCVSCKRSYFVVIAHLFQHDL